METNVPLPLDLVAVNEYVRTLVRNHENRSLLSLDCGVSYGRLGWYANNPGSSLKMQDLQRLMEHFGIVRPANGIPPVPAATSWVVHPQNPAYEYEIDADRRPTGQIRKIEVAPKVAAEQNVILARRA